MENEQELNTQNEEVASQNDTGVEETYEETQEETQEETDTDNENVPSIEDYYELQKKNKELYERAKKAEALAKTLKSTPKKADLQTNLPEEDLVRTAKLANQLDEDDLEVLKTINGSSLSEKVENPLFKAYKEQKLQKAKSEAAALKPSGGSNSYSPGIKPDMTEEEHRKLWNKMIS